MRAQRARNQAMTQTTCAPDVNVPEANPTSTRAVGEAVWDRVWRHRPSEAKDDALLARELASDRWRLVMDRVVSRFGAFQGLRTIELGAGRGDLSVLFAQRGADVTLLDCNESALTAAKERFARLGLDARFVKGDLIDDRVAPPHPFDVSLSAGVIEHFKGAHRTAVIRAHRDVLVPGGMAIVSVPNSWCVPYRVWKAYLGLRGWWPYGMEIPYSKAEITRRALDAGFDRVETHGLHLLQSIGDHWVKRLSHKSPHWASRSCMLDQWMGSILLMFGWIDHESSDATACHSTENGRVASNAQPGEGN